MNKNPKRSGFTLIELLVVISIIALLAGLAFPALQGAIDSAQKAQASTMCNQLAIAANLYNTEYGVWPIIGSSTGDFTFSTSSQWGDLCTSFNGNKTIKDGSTTTSQVANSRAIQFMSFNKKDLATPTANYVISPVKKATDRLYRMVVDGNYDGVITIADLSKSSGDSNLAMGVGVWAFGDKSTDNTKKVGSYR